jgi:hypothetical protein
MSEEASFEDLVMRALSNPAGEALLAEMSKMYVDRLSFQDGEGLKFEDTAYREGQRSVTLTLMDIVRSNK